MRPVRFKTHNLSEKTHSLPGLFKQTLTASGIHSSLLKVRATKLCENLVRTKILVPFKIRPDYKSRAAYFVPDPPSCAQLVIFHQVPLNLHVPSYTSHPQSI